MIDFLRSWRHNQKYEQDYKKKWPDLPVRDLVYFRDDPTEGCVIVFVDWSGWLDWKRDDTADQLSSQNGNEAIVSETLNKISELEVQIDGWPRGLRIRVVRMLGEAIARAFRSDETAAKEAIDSARIFVEQKAVEVSRYWALQACLLSALLFCVIGFAVRIFESQVISVIGTTGELMVLAFCAGTIGALFSIILRLGNLVFDEGAEKQLHYAEGFSRTIAGGISGVIVAGMILLEIFVPVFQEVGTKKLSILVAAIIAGASERFVPAIIAKFETQVSEGE